jgi:CRISPR/Cas system CSM-associated protein Csm2 small subunit
MAAKAESKKKSSPRGFYSLALEEAEKLELEEASDIEGIDEEIALLRVKLRELLEEQPDRIDLHFEAANIIARLVKTRYQISKEQKRSLKEAIQKVLTELAVPMGVALGGNILSTKL